MSPMEDNMARVTMAEYFNQLLSRLPNNLKFNPGKTSQSQVITRPLRVTIQRIAIGPKPIARYIPKKGIIYVYNESALGAFQQAVHECNEFFGLR